jgi:hypothetical protein
MYMFYKIVLKNALLICQCLNFFFLNKCPYKPFQILLLYINRIYQLLWVLADQTKFEILLWQLKYWHFCEFSEKMRRFCPFSQNPYKFNLISTIFIGPSTIISLFYWLTNINSKNHLFILNKWFSSNYFLKLIRK